MPFNTTTPPVRPASAEEHARAVLDALGDHFHLLMQGAAGDDSPRALERYQRAIAAVTSLELSARKNGAPQEDEKEPEARPGAGALARTGDHGGERGIRTPDTLAGTPDFESGTSPSDGNGSGEEGSGDDGEPPLSARAVRIAALAWDLVDRDPQLAARVAFDLVELDEHDPVACIAACCNSPLALEVRP
jgi:hypothetical protein